MTFHFGFASNRRGNHPSATNHNPESAHSEHRRSAELVLSRPSAHRLFRPCRQTRSSCCRPTMLGRSSVRALSSTSVPAESNRPALRSRPRLRRSCLKYMRYACRPETTRKSVISVRRSRQISCSALFDRCGKYIAACGKDRRSPFGLSAYAEILRLLSDLSSAFVDAVVRNSDR